MLRPIGHSLILIFHINRSCSCHQQPCSSNQFRNIILRDKLWQWACINNRIRSWIVSINIRCICISITNITPNISSGGSPHVSPSTKNLWKIIKYKWSAADNSPDPFIPKKSSWKSDNGSMPTPPYQLSNHPWKKSCSKPLPPNMQDGI